MVFLISSHFKQHYISPKQISPLLLRYFPFLMSMGRQFIFVVFSYLRNNRNMNIMEESNQLAMGCSFTKEELEGKETIFDKGAKVSYRLSKRLRKINCRTEMEESQTAISENVKRIENQELPNKTEVELNEILKNHFFFYSLSLDERQEIVKKMTYVSASAGSYIFKQGDPSCSFFILYEGTVQIEINGGTKKLLRKGAYFGELGLIYSAPRSASVKAIQECKLYCLTRNVFRKTLEDITVRNYDVAKKYIDSLSFFSHFTEFQKDSIAYSMFVLKYQNKQVIFKEKDDANAFFIIVSGKVQITIKDKSPLVLGVKDTFGEQSFKPNQTRGGTALAVGQTVCLSVGADSIRNILGNQISNIVFYNIQKWAIKRSFVLSKMSSMEVEKLINAGKLRQAEDNQVLFQKDEEPNKIMIILEGKANEKGVGTLLGQQFIQDKKRPSENIVKIGKGFVIQFSHEDILAATKRTIHEIANKNILHDFHHERKMEMDIVDGLEVEIKLDSLISLKKLGEGQFGKVYLVRDKDTKNTYAIKCIPKHQVIKNKMEKIVLEERNILASVKCPFIVKFCKSYKDGCFLFLLMEFIKGLEMFDVIREIGLLSKQVARFYIGSLILAIEYLHMKNVIYRDLKPENIMVEATGYLKLIDMGTAKRLKSNNGYRTFTIIGTPHYMAPEVMKGKGYTFTVDIWTLGVVLYEFVCGNLPFGDDLDDPYEIHNLILSSDLKFPGFFSDEDCKGLINQLLSKAPEARLARGFANLKNSAYFEGFDWDSLYSRSMKPPYVSKKAAKVEQYQDTSPFSTIVKMQKDKIPIAKQSLFTTWDSQF